jgi:hypothetical protein
MTVDGIAEHGPGAFVVLGGELGNTVLLLGLHQIHLQPELAAGAVVEVVTAEVEMAMGTLEEDIASVTVTVTMTVDGIAEHGPGAFVVLGGELGNTLLFRRLSSSL